MFVAVLASVTFGAVVALFVDAWRAYDRVRRTERDVASLRASVDRLERALANHLARHPLPTEAEWRELYAPTAEPTTQPTADVTHSRPSDMAAFARKA